MPVLELVIGARDLDCTLGNDAAIGLAGEPRQFRREGLRRARERHSVLWPARTGERGFDAAEVELQRVGKDGIRRCIVAPEALRIGLHEFDLMRVAAGEGEIAQRLRVDRPEAAGGAVLWRHIAEGRAVRERQALEAGAEELDEAADDSALPQHLRHREHEVGGGGTLAERARELHAHDLGQDHRDRLA